MATASERSGGRELERDACSFGAPVLALQVVAIEFARTPYARAVRVVDEPVEPLPVEADRRWKRTLARIDARVGATRNDRRIAGIRRHRTWRRLPRSVRDLERWIVCGRRGVLSKRGVGWKGRPRARDEKDQRESSHEMEWPRPTKCVPEITARVSPQKQSRGRSSSFRRCRDEP